MPLRFLADTHVPWAIVTGLRARGVDIRTAQEESLDEILDDDLLEQAGERGRVLFTQDKDFLRIASEHQSTGHSFIGIVFAPQSPPQLGRYIEDLCLMAEALEPEEVKDRLFYLPL